MIKRILALVSCLMVLLLAVAPASASSFDGTDSIRSRRYYALIPYSSKSVTVGLYSFHSSAEGSFFDFVDDGLSYDAYPTRSPIESVQYGWNYSDTDFPDPSFLKSSYVTEEYPYSINFPSASSYNAAFHKYSFLLDDVAPRDLIVSFSAKDFHVSSSQWSLLEEYALLSLPSAATVRVSFEVVYYDLGHDGKTFTRHTGSCSSVVSSSGASNVLYYPDFFDLFGSIGSPINGGFSVESLTMTLEFSSYPGEFGLGMLYGITDSAVANYAVIENTVETIIEKEVYIEVPPEDLDLFSWIIGPIQAFFAMELFPGISIAGIAGVLVTLLVVMVVIRIFG